MFMATCTKVEITYNINMRRLKNFGKKRRETKKMLRTLPRRIRLRPRASLAIRPQLRAFKAESLTPLKAQIDKNQLFLSILNFEDC
jgi:hypothetical protein